MNSGKSAEAALAKRLVVGLEGLWPTDDEWRWLMQWQPTGIILFSRNVENFPQLKHLCESLKEMVPGLEIMADHEGGPVSQLGAALGRPPVAWSLGKFDDVNFTRQVHEETGRRMKMAGLDRVLGPCADVMSEPRNPVIGARAFGADAELVSRHVKAAVEGLTAAGIACCLKHWPGHGGSGTDSHLETTVVRITPEDEAPFRSGLKAGAGAVMAGHLLFDDTGRPATLSKSFLSHTRTSLSSDGVDFVLMADDISMGGLREPMNELGVQLEENLSNEPSGSMIEVGALTIPWFEHLVDAGCDQLLLRGIPFTAFPVHLTDEKFKNTLPSGLSFPSQGGGLGDAGFSNNIYSKIRKRQIIDIFPTRDDLVLLDLSREDRWQVAGGLSPQHWTNWDQMLAANFSQIRKNDHLQEVISGTDDVSALLVTNHRPMPRQWETRAWAQSICDRLGESGHCLVMGHPSLASDFEDFLGAQWTVSSLYDISCEELI